jgi:hypothetical protein
MFSLMEFGDAKKRVNKEETASGVANLSPAELDWAVMFSKVLQA